MKPSSGASGASQLKRKTRPCSSGLPMADVLEVLGQRRLRAHQEQVPELGGLFLVALDAGFALAVQRAQWHQLAVVDDARFLQQLAPDRVLGRFAGLDRALGQLHAGVAGVEEDQQPVPVVHQAGAGLEHLACAGTLSRPRARP